MRGKILVLALIILIALLAAYYGWLREGTRTSSQISTSAPTSGGGNMSENFVLKSVFGNMGDIPIKYTCDGEDISPPLSWEGQPSGVVSYVLIVDDPDAPGRVFTHWVLYNIPSDINSLPENVPKQKETAYGIQGRNDFGRIGYGGPCPPRGKPHRYFFKLYALDVKLNLPPGASKREVENAIKGHVLAQTQIVGLYRRR